MSSKLSISTVFSIAENSTLRNYFKHCCRGKSISITYSECVSVALDIQHAVSVRLYHIFLHYFINGMTFGKKRRYTYIKCVLIFGTTFV
jgi:hypothetical protein